jgi:hypothetical protein
MSSTVGSAASGLSLLALLFLFVTSVPEAFRAAAQTPPPAAQITFHNNTMADFSATSGEPIIKVDGKDRIYVTSPFGFSLTLSLLWRSDDGGRTYIPLGSPVLRDAVPGPGGGDTDVDFDDRDRLYYIDLSAACVTVAVSEDGGNTFPADRTNYVTCVSEKEPAALDDRQWIAAVGNGRAYATWRRLTGTNPLPFWMFTTRDGGKTWDKGRQLGTVTQSGPLRADKTKRRVTVGGQEREAYFVYQIYYNGSDIRLFRVTDVEGAEEPIVENFRIFNGGSASISNVFPVLAVDTAGNLYAAWSQTPGTADTSHTIFMATSTDRGQTWSQPKRVSTFTGTNIMPWVVAGDPGRANIAWYRSTLPGNSGSLSNTWQIYMAQTLNAFDTAPHFATVPVSQNVVHRGEICLRGLNCNVEGRDRSFLEYPSVWIDRKGAAVITYNDNTNQTEAPYVMVAKQATGPSLYAAAGLLGREPGVVAVTSPVGGAQVTGQTLTVEGTHTVPPKNYDRDEANDARFRPGGPNLPGADLRSVSLSETNDSLVLSMQVADLTAAAVSAAAGNSAGDGLLYLVQWDYDDTIYWVGAEVRNNQPTFHTGTLGVISSGTSKKFITYNPDLTKSQQVRGTMNSTAPGVITITVPKSAVGSPPAGAQLHTLTAYALSQRGPLVPIGSNLLPGPTSLPVQLDASGAVTYRIGEGGPATDGAVEVSLDDLSFLSPRTDVLSSDLGQSRWRLTLAGPELVPGAHTLYVRQRINGRDYSPIASVNFTVSETIERILTPWTSLEARNASAGSGFASYDLLIRNATGPQPILTPLAARIVRLTSASGAVRVANADNGQTGAGAAFDYSNMVGGDGALSPGELSGARRLRFSNPNNEAFSAEFEIAGGVPRGSGGETASGDSFAAGSGSQPAEGANSSGTSTGAAGLLKTVLRITYNPLLNTTTIEVVQL